VASEETYTLIVNAHGALIHLALDQSGKREVGIELELASPRSWRIAFPPSDWIPRSPDAKAPRQDVPAGRAPVRKPGIPLPETDKKLTNKLP
jgi:hypothetical protein